MNGKDLVWGLIILLIGSAMIYGGWGMMLVDDYNYEYEVKAEQVNEDEMVEEAIGYENLSEPEQEVLFRAFKKSDHFLGGAEAYVETNETLDVSHEWRVVEIRGVPMLVAISGPEEVPADGELGVQFLGMMVAGFGVIIDLFGLAFVKDGLLDV